MSAAEEHHSMWPASLIACRDVLPTAAENIAFDEVLLNEVEADAGAAILRVWEPTEYFVVLGRSNRAETEVNLPFCQSQGIAVLRRPSGGGAVLVGPGCLCYSLALPLSEQQRQLGIAAATARLMERIAASLETLLPGVSVQGVSDLVWSGRKFSGNAQRWLRRSFIHHGTLLYDFDIPLLNQSLNHPSKQPDYRQSRGHLEFVSNVPCTAVQLSDALMADWNATPQASPEERLTAARILAETKYRTTEWS